MNYSIEKTDSTVPPSFSLPFQLSKVFDCTFNKRTIAYFGLITLIICLFEVLAYKFKGIYSIVSSKIWFTSFFVYMIFTLYFSLRAILDDVLKKNIISLISLTFVTFLIFYGIGNIKMLGMSYEASIQVIVGIKNFNLNDFGYVNNGFLGYPSRQYLLAALPSKILGNSVFSLHLGFAFQLYSGILICYAGLRETIIKKWQLNPYYAGIVIVGFFTFPYLIEFSLIHEQVILPISYTLHTVGWLLLLMNRLTINRSIGLMWAGGMLSTCYTPALASWTLLIVFLVIFMIGIILGNKPIATKLKPKLSVTILGLITTYITVAGICSFIYRSDRAAKVGSDSIDKIISLLKEGYKAFFIGKWPGFLGILSVFVVLYLILSLFGRLGIMHFVIAGWCLSVVGSSVILSGYAAPVASYALHRAIIIIPVITVSIAWTIFDLITKKGLKPRFIYGLIVFAVFCGSSTWNLANHHNIYEFYSKVKPIDYVIYNMDQELTKNKIDKNENFEVIYYTNDIMKKVFERYTEYLYPQAKLQLKFNDSSDPIRLNNNKGVVIYADQDTKIPKSILKYTKIENLTVKIQNTDYKMQRAIIPPVQN